MLKKRDVLLGDDSGTIDLTVWNEQAEQWSVTGKKTGVLLRIFDLVVVVGLFDVL
jgi:hypothetical protein